MNGRGLFISLCVLGCACALQAEWSEPIFLSELNDLESGAVAIRPILTADQLEIYFFRNNYLWQALRSSVDEPFTEQRIVSELGTNGQAMLYAWVSSDGLHFYYSQAKKEGGVWGNWDILRIAVRNQRGELWSPLREITELHLYQTSDKIPALTGDGCTITWITDRGREHHDYAVWTANRPSIGHPFSNLREATEFNTIGAIGPYLSFDGLTAYCSIPNEQGYGQLYKAKRLALNEPFADFEPIEDLNQWGVATHSPWISPDENTIYFFQRWEEPGDATSMGICMSTWISEPCEIAIKNLEEAVSLKQQSIELINQADAKERGALSAIGGLVQGDGAVRPDKVRYWQARMRILQAMTKQAVARLQIKEGLRKLAEAIALLTGEPDTPQNPREKPERKK